MPSPVTCVHHLTLRVSDVGRSRRFYEDILGFEVDQDFGDEKVRFRLAPGCATRLVLRPPLAGTPRGEGFSERRIGLDHVAVGVDGRGDLERFARALVDAGVSTRGVQRVPGGGRLVAFRDPDGIQWELFAD